MSLEPSTVKTIELLTELKKELKNFREEVVSAIGTVDGRLEEQRGTFYQMLEQLQEINKKLSK